MAEQVGERAKNVNRSGSKAENDAWIMEYLMLVWIISLPIIEALANFENALYAHCAKGDSMCMLKIFSVSYTNSRLVPVRAEQKK